jgi:hypothetical protein
MATNKEGMVLIPNFLPTLYHVINVVNKLLTKTKWSMSHAIGKGEHVHVINMIHDKQTLGKLTFALGMLGKSIKVAITEDSFNNKHFYLLHSTMLYFLCKYSANSKQEIFISYSTNIPLRSIHHLLKYFVPRQIVCASTSETLADLEMIRKFTASIADDIDTLKVFGPLALSISANSENKIYAKALIQHLTTTVVNSSNE